jgi:GDPmannose 4,6-dehydratase
MDSSKKLAFITGITGQDGSYLSELLLEKGYKVFGIVRRTSLLFSHTRLDHISNKLVLEYGDMTDGASLTNYIHKIVREHPDFDQFEIYNLAAQSHVKISFDNPEYTTQVDAVGTLRLLESIRALPKNVINRIRFYQAGTSEMFGDVLENQQKETTPFNPVSPYACAKVYSHYLVKNYRDGYGMFLCNGILFNHESPRRGENFVTMKVVNGVKKIANAIATNVNNGKDATNDLPVLRLGNIDSFRDWGHARDYTRGMWIMLQQDKPDDYVLATGKTYSVRDFVERCFKKIGKTIVWEGKGRDEIGKDHDTGAVLVKIDEKYYRPCEVEYLLGDPSKAERVLGWKREYDLDALINDMFAC